MPFIHDIVSPLAKPPEELPKHPPVPRDLDFSNVTALVKTYLREAYLADCVRSLQENYRGIHVSIADDGPWDAAKVSYYQGLDCQWISLPENSGLSCGRNRLVEFCTTKYCLIGDDDFLYFPNTRLDWLRTLLEETGADVAAGAIYQEKHVVHYEGRFHAQLDGGLTYERPCGDWSHPEYELSASGVRFQQTDLALNFFTARTESLRGCPWDERLHGYEHEDFFLMAAERGLRTVYCPDVLCGHRMRDGSDPVEYQQKRYDRSSAPIFREKWSTFRYIRDTCGRRIELNA